MSGITVLARLAKSVVRSALFFLTTPQMTYLIGEPIFRLTRMRGGDGAIDLGEIERILVVRLDEIGDVVLTTPLLRELRRNLPEAWITLVVKPAVYNLVECCPYVDEVLTFDRSQTDAPPNLKRHRRTLTFARDCLWRRRFDLAISPRWDIDEYYGGFVAYLSGAPWRVGYSESVNIRKSRINNGYDQLFTYLLDNSAVKHEAERGLDILKSIGGVVKDDHLELWLDLGDEAFTDRVLSNDSGRRKEILVVFALGARVSRRIWPIDRFAELGQWLQQEYDARILLVGGKGEEELGWRLGEQLGTGTVDLVGRTTLRQSFALMKRCRLYVGNDAGPMHLAAAAGLPVVEISCHPMNGDDAHANSPQRFGPWSVPNVVVQPESPRGSCTDGCDASEAHCIIGVSVEKVKESVAMLLSQHDSAVKPNGVVLYEG